MPVPAILKPAAAARRRFYGVRRSELGSWILGPEDESPRRRTARVQALLATSLVASNLVGVAIVLTLIFFVLPGPDLLARRFLVPTAIVTPVYVSLATLGGAVWVTLLSRRALRWSIEGREPDREERLATLSLPWRFTLAQGSLWAGGAVVQTLSYGLVDPESIPPVGFTITFSGLIVCSAAFLFAEFGLRPVAAVALADDDPREGRFAGAMTRVRVVWALGNGIPVIGLGIVAIYQLAGHEIRAERLAVIILALGGASIVVGFVLTSLLATSVLDPVRALRRGVDAVTAGDLGKRVVIYDGTEIGDLQRGFNRMAEGLRERERLRDLFERHVGPEVARAAEERDPELGGRDVDVAVLFVDIIGSTRMAEEHDPADVVVVLNEFFEVVVEEVIAHDGLVDKFLGDAALAIFGAPGRLDDPASAALACGRALARQLEDRVRGCHAGIGISFGPVVAGYVGARNRFEYTVIGDAVNEAARLCELAKKEPSRLLASGRALDAACAEERERWSGAGTAVVRGRLEPTVLARPAG